jgi:dTDP-4-dehydrorhamnose reductase
MKVLILGASGLLGTSIIKSFKQKKKIIQFPIFRKKSRNLFSKNKNIYPIYCKNLNINKLDKIFKSKKPDIVINCISTRHLNINDKKSIIELNAFFPHKINFLCTKYSSKFINISSDGIFTGFKGNYKEEDKPDAQDIYGLSKFLGETYGKNSIVIRTSFIGHEYFHKNGLLEWFISQKKCNGYSNYIYTGLTSNLLAEIIRDEVITRPKLNGVFNLSASPITKYNLLVLISKIYKKDVIINKISNKKINRVLLNKKFTLATGYKFKNWQKMITEMKNQNEKKS